jgi:hypothetical protein
MDWNRPRKEVGQTKCMRKMTATLLILFAFAGAIPYTWSKLPRLEATALDGSRLVLPDSVGTRIALVGFAYRRDSQEELNSWLVPFRSEYMPADGFLACEVPMMGPRIPGVLRGVINGGMRRAIPRESWRWVAPFYGNIDEYSKRLGVSDRSRVQMLLLDGSGVIRWHAAGPADSTGLAGLMRAVAELAAGGGE